MWPPLKPSPRFPAAPTRWARRLLLLGPLMALGACTLNGDLGAMMASGDAGPAGDGSVGTSSGVSRSVRLMDLGEQQASVLCDWTNLKQGGYGHSITCSSGAVRSTNASNRDCVNQTAALGGLCVAATVGDIEDCANAIGSDLCQYATAAACMSLATCTL